MPWFRGPIGYTLDLHAGPFRAPAELFHVDEKHPALGPLRQSKSVVEITDPNGIGRWRFAAYDREESPRRIVNAAALPVPMDRIPVVLGRAASGAGVRERYPRERFAIWGVNPGVDPQYTHRHYPPEHLRVAGHAELDVLCSFDAGYAAHVGKEFVRNWTGPSLLTPECAPYNIGGGPVAVFDFWKVPPPVHTNQSMVYAMSFLAMAGVPEIVLAGCDLIGDEDRRKKTKNAVTWLERLYGTKFYRDPAVTWDGLAPAYEPKAVAA